MLVNHASAWSVTFMAAPNDPYEHRFSTISHQNDNRSSRNDPSSMYNRETSRRLFCQKHSALVSQYKPTIAADEQCVDSGFLLEWTQTSKRKMHSGFHSKWTPVATELGTWLLMYMDVSVHYTWTLAFDLFGRHLQFFSDIVVHFIWTEVSI